MHIKISSSAQQTIFLHPCALFSTRTSCKLKRRNCKYKCNSGPHINSLFLVVSYVALLLVTSLLHFFPYYYSWPANGTTQPASKLTEHFEIKWKVLSSFSVSPRPFPRQKNYCNAEKNFPFFPQPIASHFRESPISHLKQLSINCCHPAWSGLSGPCSCSFRYEMTGVCACPRASFQFIQTHVISFPPNAQMLNRK